jgi:tRNA threonylcarbamoyladenosine biosynthesis protein TsaE
MTWPLEVVTNSPDATRDVAARLASLCASGDVVLLIGDLGAGKTVFAQGFAAALGVSGPVTSPTFALVRQYACGAGSPVETFIHADVYRTGSLAEVVDLALAEMVEDGAIALVEWGDMAAPALGDDALDITLRASTASSSTDERIFSISGRGTWARRGREVAHVLEGAARRVEP